MAVKPWASAVGRYAGAAAKSGDEGRALIARAFPDGGRLNVNANPKPA